MIENYPGILPDINKVSLPFFKNLYFQSFLGFLDIINWWYDFFLDSWLWFS